MGTQNSRKIKKSGRLSGGKKALLITGAVLIGIVLGFVLLYSAHVKPPEITPPALALPSVSIDPETGEASANPSGDPFAGAGTKVPGRKDDFYTVLMAGTDKGGGLTDVLMVAAFDVANMTVEVVNIPRDTMVNVSRDNKKINSAYGFGGIEQLYDEVESVIGFKPDRYMVIDLQGFEELVDAVGGVEFDVPVRMYYSDPKQNLKIDLQKGEQWLNGRQALEMVRFRSGYANQDLGRIATTQKFLKALAKQTLQLSNITKIPKFVELAMTYLKTDLSVGEMIWFGQQAVNVDTEENLNFHTLSETSGSYKGLSYVLLNEDEVLELVNETINPYTYKITDVDILNPRGGGGSSSKPSGSSGNTKPAQTQPPSDLPASSDPPVEVTQDPGTQTQPPDTVDVTDPPATEAPPPENLPTETPPPDLNVQTEAPAGSGEGIVVETDDTPDWTPAT